MRGSTPGLSKHRAYVIQVTVLVLWAGRTPSSCLPFCIVSVTVPTRSRVLYRVTVPPTAQLDVIMLIVRSSSFCVIIHKNTKHMLVSVTFLSFLFITMPYIKHYSQGRRNVLANLKLRG